MNPGIVVVAAIGLFVLVTLAKGIRIVQELGLDKRYGYKVGPVSAVAA